MPVPSEIVVKVLMQQRADLIGYAWIVVGDPETAEDVFQDVSVVAIRKCDEIENDEHLIGWLYNAIRLEGLKARRNQQQARQLLRPEVLQVLEQVRSQGHGQTQAEQESDYLPALRECINLLQGEVRKVLELRYGQNLKPAKIAKLTGKKIQTVYKTITRSHSTLRDCVEQRLSARGDAS